MREGAVLPAAAPGEEAGEPQAWRLPGQGGDGQGPVMEPTLTRWAWQHVLRPFVIQHIIWLLILVRFKEFSRSYCKHYQVYYV